MKIEVIPVLLKAHQEREAQRREDQQDPDSGLAPELRNAKRHEDGGSVKPQNDAIQRKRKPGAQAVGCVVPKHILPPERLYRIPR